MYAKPTTAIIIATCLLTSSALAGYVRDTDWGCYTPGPRSAPLPDLNDCQVLIDRLQNEVLDITVEFPLPGSKFIENGTCRVTLECSEGTCAINPAIAANYLTYPLRNICLVSEQRAGWYKVDDKLQLGLGHSFWIPPS
ncbi:hypothetical protein BJ170DRAFT_125240 [Xylariales sp. AK1849]|nr:hypothetical protein BJ170DRAFT_125240 [Xylariales sp. AK1849]